MPDDDRERLDAELALRDERITAQRDIQDERWRAHGDAHGELARSLSDYKKESNEWRGTVNDIENYAMLHALKRGGLHHRHGRRARYARQPVPVGGEVREG